MIPGRTASPTRLPDWRRCTPPHWVKKPIDTVYLADFEYGDWIPVITIFIC
jgi:hypothetical protein